MDIRHCILLQIPCRVGMKILLISNIEGCGDRLAESIDLNGTAIVARELDVDAKALAAHAAKVFPDSGYDLIIAVTDNPIGTSMVLNKYDGINASVCNDADDAASARENGINAVVMKYENLPKINGIIAGIASGTGKQMRIRVPVLSDIQQRAKSIGAAVSARPAAQGARSQKPRRAADAEDADDEKYDKMPKRPGFSGWIKDTLGIVDEDNAAQGSKRQKQS